MDESTVALIIAVVYTLAGSWAVSYVKSEILNVVAEFYSGGCLGIILKNIVWGFFFGWLAIPVAIIHKLIFNR